MNGLVINNNMRCFEIVHLHEHQQGIPPINNNMRCFEMLIQDKQKVKVNDKQ